jgi:4-hydroxybenzoyl-CoA reductase subunit beta
MHDFVYHRPASLAELWSLVASAKGPVSPLAGGTDLVPALKLDTLRPAAVADLKRCAELRPGVRHSPDDGLVVGATTTLHDLARSPLVAATWPALAEAAATVASYQIRNRGTVGGNLCLDTRCSYYNQSAFWRQEYPDCRKLGGGSCYVVPAGDGCHALSSSDLAPIMVALEAGLEVAAASGDRVLPAETFFSGDGLRATVLQAGEVVTKVHLPPAAGRHLVFRRFAQRETIDFPMLSVAAAAGPGGVRLVVGHVASRPLRASAGEAVLAAYLSEGRGTPGIIGEAVVDELRLTSSVRGAVSYKKRVLQTVVAGVAVELATAVSAGRGRDV